MDSQGPGSFPTLQPGMSRTLLWSCWILSSFWCSSFRLSPSWERRCFVSASRLDASLVPGGSVEACRGE